MDTDEVSAGRTGMQFALGFWKSVTIDDLLTEASLLNLFPPRRFVIIGQWVRLSPEKTVQSNKA